MNTHKGVLAMGRIFTGLLLALVLVSPVSAQTYLTSTTNSAAVNATQTTITLASTTGVAAGGGLYVDREYLPVRSVSGLVATVLRGQSGTTGRAHTADRTVIIIPAAAVPTVVTAVDPAQTSGVGGCTPAAYQFLPIINVTNGNVWSCRWLDNVRQWAATNTTLITYNSLILR